MGARLSFKLKDCTVLSLSDAGLGDSGVKVLAASLAAGGGAPNVVEVNLSNNGIGDEVCANGHGHSRPLDASPISDTVPPPDRAASPSLTRSLRPARGWRRSTSRTTRSETAAPLPSALRSSETPPWRRWGYSATS